MPIILSGGSGTRLWPASRKNHPKQFLALTNDHSLLQNTVLRLQNMEALDAPLIICNETHRFMVAEQLHELDVKPNSIYLEPVGKNTAPAIAIAAFHAQKQDKNAIIAVFPSDHIIENKEALQQSLVIAEQQAQQNALVTFGIVPTWVETGYGYIQRGRIINEDCWRIARFAEKPNAVEAKHYFQSGEYYWNSGMFMFRADVYLNTLKRWQPTMFNACSRVFAKRQCDLDFIRFPKDLFDQIPANSIDYAVMEKTDAGVVVPLDAGWSDIGSWSALWAIRKKDEHNNVFKGNVISEQSQNCLVESDGRLVSLLGVNNLIIVDTKDAVLIASKESVQDVKKIVGKIKQQGRSEADIHREVYRPWGKYDSVDVGLRYQVKRITVKPGEILSLQKHYHRSEHWIVVSGTAEVTCDDRVFLLTENQSTYIPLGSTHRLVNPGKLPLELIEVQSGSYLGEDDIVRFDDIYGRDNKNNIGS